MDLYHAHIQNDKHVPFVEGAPSASIRGMVFLSTNVAGLKCSVIIGLDIKTFQRNRKAH